MAAVRYYVAVLFLSCFLLVESAVFTDGRWVVEWRPTGQDRPRRGGVSCFLYDARKGTSPGSVPAATLTQTHTTNSSAMSRLVDECIRKQRLDLLRHHKQKVKRSFLNLFSGIYPGTKWCGQGNVASDPDDLGLARKADSCCREHDTTCDLFVLAGESKYGVTNKEIYTINDCRCDQRFHDCLQRADTITSNNIGELFFDIIRVKCLQVTSTVPGSVHGTIQPPQPYRRGPIGGLLTGLLSLEVRVPDLAGVHK